MAREPGNANNSWDGTKRHGMGRGKTGQGGAIVGKTGQDGARRDRTGQDGTGRDRTGQDRTGRGKTGQDGARRSRTGQDGAGPDRTGQYGIGWCSSVCEEVICDLCPCSASYLCRIFTFPTRLVKLICMLVQDRCLN